jgi:hypothetical protein
VCNCYAEGGRQWHDLHPSNHRWSLSYGHFKRTLFRIAEQLPYFLSGVLHNWILCSAWKKWIIKPYNYGDDAMRPWKGSSELEVLMRSKLLVPLSSWNLWQMVCSTFLRSGWSVVRSASLSNGGTLKKRPSLHLHKVLTWSNKVSPLTFQTALVYCKFLTSETHHHSTKPIQTVSSDFILLLHKEIIYITLRQNTQEMESV